MLRLVVLLSIVWLPTSLAIAHDGSHSRGSSPAPSRTAPSRPTTTRAPSARMAVPRSAPSGMLQQRGAISPSSFRRSPNPTMGGYRAPSYGGLARPSGRRRRSSRRSLSKTVTHLTNPSELDGFRQWTDETGKFTTTARLVHHQDGNVWLRKPNHDLVRIPFDALSIADQKHIERQSRELSSSTLAPGLRRWTDKSSRHSVEARLVQYQDGTVWLRKHDGDLAKVDFADLSPADQAFVKSAKE